MNDITDLTTGCRDDVIFVVDESRSVGNVNYGLVKSFLSDLVGKLDIDSGNTRVGLVPYSTIVDTREAFNLNAHSSVTSVQSAISSLTWGGRFGFTFTDRALAHVRTTMLTSAAGDRSDESNVVFLLTDGASTNTAGTQVCTVCKILYFCIL